MLTYSIVQWIAIFAFYCLFGWIFESIYVSIEYRKPVNRGFLYGPVLPIYGFGAIVMLLITLPFRFSIVLIFISGMIGATVLEYITGYLMEKIFGVRYWDYTYEPFNLNGYICLGCSLMWGMFSVLITRFMHKPVEKFILSFDNNVLTVFDVLFIIVFIVDIYESARAAFDLKKLFKEHIENSETMIKLQKRMDVLMAFANEDFDNMKNKLEQQKNEREEELEQIKEKLNIFKEKYDLLKEQNNKRIKHIINRNPKISSIKNRIELDSLKNIFIKNKKND